MSKTKPEGVGFTPGPWAASKYDPLRVVADRKEHGEGVLKVAECYTEQDARLIAAAPEMHDTLLDAARWLERAANLLNDYDPTEAALFRGDAEGIRAALAKACNPSA